MPLSLAFTNPPGKNLYSIEENDDEGSLNSNEDDVLALLSSNKKTTSRRSSESSSTSSSRILSTTAKTSEQPTSSSSSFISERIKTMEIQQKLQDEVSTTNETSKTTLQRNEANMSAILNGMQQLQVQMTSFDERERILADELKLSNDNHKEALLSLKSSAENERKVLQTQMNIVKSSAADQQSGYEQEISLLNKEIDEFEVEKNEMFMEKEKLNKERKDLEQATALFEQRKIAAQDTIDNAEHIKSSICEAEARLRDEMDRLGDLSEHIRQKDIEAQDKLGRADNLKAYSMRRVLLSNKKPRISRINDKRSLNKDWISQGIESLC